MPSTERTDGTAQVPSDGSRGNGEATAEFVEQWRNAAYNCYSSGHKFCREVCPVMQVTRNEVHTPTAFHANVVAMEKRLLSIEDVARDYPTAVAALRGAGYETITRFSGRRAEQVPLRWA